MPKDNKRSKQTEHDTGVQVYTAQAFDSGHVDINAVLEKVGIKRHPHQMYVAFKLVHYDEPNSNNHMIELVEGMGAWWTLENVPIDIEHETSEQKKQENPFNNKHRVIGSVLYSNLVIPEGYEENLSDTDKEVFAELKTAIDDHSMGMTFPINEGEKPYLFGLGAIYKNKYPEETTDMVQDFVDGRLKFSMETRFHKLACKVCEGEFLFGESVCDHLNDNITDRNIERSPKAMRDTFFTAASRVKNPADKDADALALGAKNDNNGGNEMSVYKTFETQGDFDEFRKGLVKEIKAELEEENKSDEPDPRIKELTEENESILEKSKEDKDALEGQLNDLKEQMAKNEDEATKLLEAKQKVEEDLQKVTNEFDNFKAELEKNETFAKRISELSAKDAAKVVAEDDEGYPAFKENIMSFTDDQWEFHLNMIPESTNTEEDKNKSDEERKREEIASSSQLAENLSSSAVGDGESGDDDGEEKTAGDKISDILNS